MYNRIALIVEILVLLLAVGVIFYLSSSFTDFTPSSLGDNANTLAEQIKNLFGGTEK